MLIVNSNFSSRLKAFSILFLLSCTANFYKDTGSALYKPEGRAFNRDSPCFKRVHGIKVGDRVSIENMLSEHPLLLWFVHYALFQEIWIWCIVLCFLGQGKLWALWEWGGVLNKERKDLRQRSKRKIKQYTEKTTGLRRFNPTVPNNFYRHKFVQCVVYSSKLF